jgi:general secretion pathway protein F
VSQVHFRIKALDPDAGVCVLAVDASDETEARRQVLAGGRQIISISRGWSTVRRAKARIALVAFSQELVALLDAGLTLVEGIDTLTEKEPVAGTRHALQQIRARLFEGRTLSAALEEFPLNFPPLYVATVRASERTGSVREALTRYIAYQQQIDLLRKKLISASIYPLVLAGAGLLVTLFLLGYVVPRFSAIYEDLGSELPTASRFLMNWGRLMHDHGLAVFLCFVASAAMLTRLAVRPSIRAAMSRRMGSIPVIGRQMHLYQLARLYRTVGMLLRGGMPAVPSFEMSAGLLSVGLRPSLALATQAVREGQSLANSLQRFDLTTPVATRMLRVGERSGNIGEMMERVASFYDEELARTVDLLTRLIEPALMTVVGLVIGIIVVLMYFPIFELAGSIR